MKLLPRKKDRKPIMSLLINYFKLFHPGEVIYSRDIVRHVKKYRNGKRNPDTVLKYLRTLRQKEKLNYTCEHKEIGRFRILKLGEPHSL